MFIVGPHRRRGKSFFKLGGGGGKAFLKVDRGGDEAFFQGNIPHICEIERDRCCKSTWCNVQEGGSRMPLVPMLPAKLAGRKIGS